jgi:putative aminopeptidase FrvX
MACDVAFLRDLCLTPGPSGFEGPVQRLLRKRVGGLAKVCGDSLGNLWAELTQDGSPHVVVVAHADQIGMIVTDVDDDGFVSFRPIGKVDCRLLPGRNLVLHTDRGPVEGVVGHRPAIFATPGDRQSADEARELYLDIGAVSGADPVRRVEVGDAITFAPRFLEMSADRYASQAVDDRAGVYVTFRALELYAEQPAVTRFTAVSTVHEETTFMGAKSLAQRLHPDCMIVVDADYATDHPGVDRRQSGGEVRLGAGPVIARGVGSNSAFVRLARDVASSEDIPVQIKAEPASMETDADELMAAGTGATLSLSVPVRYMHSPFEVVCPDDLVAAANLVAAVARRLGDVFEPDMFRSW